MTGTRVPHELIASLLREPFEILELRPHPLQSSCPLTAISLRTVSGARHEWLLKDLSTRSTDAGPAFLYDPRREIAAYRWLADELPLPRLVAARERGARWLLLERVEGEPLWQCDDSACWCEAARWLADLHALEKPPGGAPWVSYDGPYFDRWMPRALEFAPDAGLARLQHAHEAAISNLTRAPAVMLHGDYYPSNILAGTRVRALDFELAGLGPAALDLAALLTGLEQPLADAALDAYRSRMGDAQAGEGLEWLLPCARLHLAVRWLGWMPERRPPVHQRFDWVHEAHAAAAALETEATIAARA